MGRLLALAKGLYYKPFKPLLTELTTLVLYLWIRWSTKGKLLALAENTRIGPIL